MKVTAVRMIDGPAKITIELTSDELARLDAIVNGAGGLGAGATDPNSPLRLVIFRACQRLRPVTARVEAAKGPASAPSRTGIW